MAGSAGRTEGLSILRTLYRELRPTVNPPESHVYQTQLWKYIVGLCKTCRNTPTGGELQEEVQKNLESTGRSYIFYLQSYKEYHRIVDDYKGAGERSAGDTAKLLGFKMPDEPRDPPKHKPKKSETGSGSSDCSQNNSSSIKGQVSEDKQSSSSSSSTPFSFTSSLQSDR